MNFYEQHNLYLAIDSTCPKLYQ